MMISEVDLISHKFSNIFSSLLVIFILTGMSSCKNEIQPQHLVGEAQGTYYAITYYDSLERDFSTELDSLFSNFDQSASVYKPESIISRVNRNDSTVVIDDIFQAVFNKSMEVSESTQGAFDITVMPLVNAWGFGYKGADRSDTINIDSLKQFVGYKKIRIENGSVVKDNAGIMIDYNAIAQGYTCDLIGAFFEKHGINNYLVDVGGEVLAKGTKPGSKPWNVAVEKPADSSASTREIQIIVPLENRALATSGNYRAYFVKDNKKYSHTIDPVTGFPVNHSVLSVSVIANQCMTADAYATAFMVMGLEKTKAFLKSSYDLDAYIIYDDNGTLKSWWSEGFPIPTKD